VLHEVVPQDLGNIRHAHGRTGVAGIGLLDRIHAEGTFSMNYIMQSVQTYFCSNWISGVSSITLCPHDVHTFLFSSSSGLIRVSIEITNPSLLLMI
jgi:hypothetical protein